jgi:hypothetical protein
MVSAGDTLERQHGVVGNSRYAAIDIVGPQYLVPERL